MCPRGNEGEVACFCKELVSKPDIILTHDTFYCSLYWNCKSTGDGTKSMFCLIPRRHKHRSIHCSGDLDFTLKRPLVLMCLKKIFSNSISIDEGRCFIHDLDSILKRPLVIMCLGFFFFNNPIAIRRTYIKLAPFSVREDNMSSACLSC